MNTLIKKSDHIILRRLTEKRYQFVLEYTSNHFNKTQAAIDAGYSKKSAAMMGNRLTKDTKILAAIRYISERALKKNPKVTVEFVLQKMFEAVSYRVADLFNDDGSMKHPKDFPEDIQTAIDGIELEETYSPNTEETIRKFKVKMTPRGLARDQLAKVLGMYLENLGGKDIKNINWDDLLGRVANREDDIDEIDDIEQQIENA